MHKVGQAEWIDENMETHFAHRAQRIAPGTDNGDPDGDTGNHNLVQKGKQFNICLTYKQRQLIYKMTHRLYVKSDVVAAYEDGST